MYIATVLILSLSTPQGDDTPSIETLVPKLASESIEVREGAYRSILKLGKPAVPTLKALLKKQKDGEVIARLNALILELTPVRLDDILDRVRVIASNNAWAQRGWTDPVLEARLSQLLARLRASNLKRELRLPVEFDDAVPIQNLGPFALRSDGAKLRVMKSGSVTAITRTILLVDGSVDISYADDSLVLATGAVSVSHGNGNIIIAGRYVEISHDGDESPRKASTDRGSVVLSGSAVHIAHSHGSIVGAPDVAWVSHSRNSVYINTPTREVSHDSESQELRIRSLHLESDGLAKGNPLAKVIVINGLLKENDDPGAVIFSLAGKKGEYVVRHGKPVTGPDGMELTGLEGFTVKFITSEYALFGSPKGDMAFRRVEKGIEPISHR